MIDSQLVNNKLFPGGKLPPYGVPYLGRMYDYIVGCIDHWVEMEAEFDGLNVADDVVQSEESYHRVVQQLAVECVRMRRIWARASRQGDLECGVEALTGRVRELGVAVTKRDNFGLSWTCDKWI